MPQKITIELTEDQINKILESRPQKIIEQEMFSITQASKIIDVGKTKIYALIKSGEISTIRIGKSPKICRAEIDKFSAEKKILLTTDNSTK